MRHPSPPTYGQPYRASWPSLHSHASVARPDALPPIMRRALTVLLAGLGLALMLISLQPFATASLVSDTGADQGSPINQFGFLGAGLVFALATMSLASRKTLASLLSPGLVLLGLVLAYNLAVAPQPDSTLRAVILTVIGMFIAFSVLVLPGSERDFQTALIGGAAAALAMSYGGLLLLPGIAVHGYDAFEPQHAGLWRGHFSHKNIAGPVMCVIAIFGVYLMRSRHRFAGFLIFSASALFVLNTGSKTTSGLFPIAILIVMAATIFGRSAAAVLLHLGSLAGAYLFTLGSLAHPRISYLVLDFLGDQTYTGRTTLWEFSLSKIPEHPWLGFGLYNFWGTDNVFGLDKPIEAAWDYRFIVHGHNNYLDILLALGVLGGAVLFWFLYVGPVINYLKARRNPANRKLADMFYMIIVFMSLLSFLETFFLARVDPIWLMHVFAVLGLHLLARFDVGSEYRRPALT